MSSSMETDPQLPNGNSTSAGATPAVGTGAAAIKTTSSKIGQLSESLKLEHQFLRVPFKYYKKTIRANHRIVEKEVSAVISGVSEAADSDLSHDDAVHQLNSLVSRLQGLKRKVIYYLFTCMRNPQIAFFVIHILIGFWFYVAGQEKNSKVKSCSIFRISSQVELGRLGGDGGGWLVVRVLEVGFLGGMDDLTKLPLKN
ncbi:LisH/CRA/RING-U-box domains-containing protein [Abeliophyllum distichum]|uniref:LisH/CRA/RING-U-box domains-containing protein n=1 Tax=Abeliophyllum distichum TaxID=126358 RepID=A0ABD1STG6_9LAMI